jgi:hypothetical protein
MEPSFVIGNIIWNTGLVAIVGVLAKGWMNRVEATIKENRDERTHQLEGIYNELKTANGRTAKIEGELKSVKAVCAERHPNGKGHGV